MTESRARAWEQQDRKQFHKLRLLFVVVLTCCSLAAAQHWTPVTLPFPGNAGTAMLLTDGLVIVEDNSSGLWWLLVPDDTGKYSNGIWVLAGIPLSNYAPLYFASAILPDGRMIVEGGEYNSGDKVDTTLGAIFDPTTFVWTEVSPPAGWDKIGDAPSVVLPNGTFMLGACCHIDQALLHPKTLTWTQTGAGKADGNSEEGWTLLPNGKVLTIDTKNGVHSELYDPSSGTWSLTGDLPRSLASNCGRKDMIPEIGPAVLRPDGTVFATGANRRTAIYTPSSGTWKAGPLFPKGFGVADGPAALLPNGNVLVMASPCFKAPSILFEFDGSTLSAAPQPPGAVFDKSYKGRMLVLPNSHILLTDDSSDVEIYVPAGSPKADWLPTITAHPSTVTRGKAYTVKGKQLNGLSQGAAYGDDAQSATNFPLVRFTNNATGHVSYARTKNFSTMGVATGNAIVSATFIPSSGMETGASTMVVVANGLASAPVHITVN